MWTDRKKNDQVILIINLSQAEINLPKRIKEEGAQQSDVIDRTFYLGLVILTKKKLNTTVSSVR